MRLILCFVFLCGLMPNFAQGRYYSLDDSPAYHEYDDADYKRKYPYVKGYTPSFLGLVVGYNVLKAQEVEVGLVYNLYEEETVFGLTSGYQLIYKRSLEREQNAIDLEMGIYGLLSMGMGVNYNFSNDVSAFGFKPFIGTSIYHFQVLYGYNFLRKEKRDWYQLSSHSLSIRYVLPIKAKKKTYFPPPAPIYQYLPGLHKKQPADNPTP